MLREAELHVRVQPGLSSRLMVIAQAAQIQPGNHLRARFQTIPSRQRMLLLQ